MKKLNLIVTALSIVIILISQSSTTSASLDTFPPFLVNLQQGATHPDVLLLQKYLNASGFSVATSGPGSTGNETTYFGSATKSALGAFQNAHKNEILIPQRLSIGSGNFLESTRNFVNSQLKKILPAPAQQSTTTPETPKTTEEMVIPPPQPTGINLTPFSVYGHHRNRSRGTGELVDPTITFNGATGTNDGVSFPYLVATVTASSNSNGSITYFLNSGDPALFSVNATTGQIYALQAGASGSIQIGAMQAASGSYNAKTVYATVTIFSLT